MRTAVPWPQKHKVVTVYLMQLRGTVSRPQWLIVFRRLALNQITVVLNGQSGSTESILQVKSISTSSINNVSTCHITFWIAEFAELLDIAVRVALTIHW